MDETHRPCRRTMRLARRAGGRVVEEVERTRRPASPREQRNRETNRPGAGRAGPASDPVTSRHGEVTSDEAAPPAKRAQRRMEPRETPSPRSANDRAAIREDRRVFDAMATDLRRIAGDRP